MHALPITTWLSGYRGEWLRADLFAGLTVWALVVPQAIAYAQIAGLPPQAGVFASFAAPLGYALFGTSRQLIVSPTSATAAISASLVAPLAVADDPGEYAALSAALAILCGLVFILLGRFRMGFLSQFIATAVQTGFLAGLGLTIIVGQLFKVFGTSDRDGPFYRQAWHLLTHLDETNGPTLAIGGLALAALLALRRLAPGVPAALVLVGLSIVLVTIFDLDDQGVAVVGPVDRAVPLPAIPSVAITDLLALVPGTLAIVIVGFSESMSIARGFADRHHQEVRPDQELVALGMSSIFGGVFQGFITGGGASQSAANDRAGARTQVSSLVLAGLAFLSAVALLPLFRNLPLAVLGAIVISAVLGFVNIPALRRIQHLRRDSFILACLAFVGVLALGILPGLLVTVALSILLLLSRLARPSAQLLGQVAGLPGWVSLIRHEDAVPEPGLLIYRQDAPLIFVNASWMRDSLRGLVANQAETPAVIVLDLEATADLDINGLDVLTAIQREYAQRGIPLWLAGVHAPVRAMVQRGGLAEAIGVTNIHATVDEAAKAFRERESTQGV